MGVARASVAVLFKPTPRTYQMIGDTESQSNGQPAILPYAHRTRAVEADGHSLQDWLDGWAAAGVPAVARCPGEVDRWRRAVSHPRFS